MSDPFFAPWALVLLPLGYFSLWPVVSRFIERGERPQPLLETALLTFALSPALLAVILFWLGILPGSNITPLAALIALAGIWTAGFVLNPRWLGSVQWRAKAAAGWNALRRLDAQSLILWTLIGACWIMLIHALYYPFIGEDVLSNYGLAAKRIYLAQRIPDQVTGYPPLVPLMWASTWFAAGHINEHLARVYSVMQTAAVIGASYLLGREVGGRRLGLTAALLMALTPVLLLFGTLDYTDIPTAFPLTLSVVYVLRWWKSASWYDALWAGLMLAAAMFTKQSAFMWLASDVAVLVLWLLNLLRTTQPRRGQNFAAGASALLLPVLIIAAPWYYRNLKLTGLLFPVAGLWHILGPNAGLLGGIPPIARLGDFGLLTPLYTAGWLIGIARAVWQGINTLRMRLDQVPSQLVLGLFAIPYWLVWWYTFSFEAHYLLLILPIMAVWAAEPLLWMLDWIHRRVSLPPVLTRIGVGIALMVLLFAASRGRLGAVYYALTRPFASEADRLRHVHSHLYDQVVYIQTHFDPETDRIMAMDVRLPYFLPEFQIVTAYPQRLSDLEGFDYLVHSSSFYGIYDGRLGWNQSEFFLHALDRNLFESVYESGGVHIMRILSTRLSDTP